METYRAFPAFPHVGKVEDSIGIFVWSGVSNVLVFFLFSIYARFSFIVIFNTVTIDIRVIQTYNHVCDYIHTEYKGIDNYRKKYTVYHRWMLVLYYFPTTYKPALKALF